MTTDDVPESGVLPVPVDPATLPTRRERRLAARAAGRVDARGPRTGEFEVPDAVRAAREAAGLSPELSATTRHRWLLREEAREAARRSGQVSPTDAGQGAADTGPRGDQDDGRDDGRGGAGRHRG